jgi:hypothetical protein
LKTRFELGHGGQRKEGSRMIFDEDLMRLAARQFAEKELDTPEKVERAVNLLLARAAYDLRPASRLMNAAVTSAKTQPENRTAAGGCRQASRRRCARPPRPRAAVIAHAPQALVKRRLGSAGL